MYCRFSPRHDVISHVLPGPPLKFHVACDNITSCRHLDVCNKGNRPRLQAIGRERVRGTMPGKTCWWQLCWTCVSILKSPSVWVESLYSVPSTTPSLSPKNCSRIFVKTSDFRSVGRCISCNISKEKKEKLSDTSWVYLLYIHWFVCSSSV